MKKFFIMMIAMVMAVSMFAQTQSNYAGSSKFTDNTSVTLQGGVLTTFDNFFAGHTAMAPIVVLGVDKYVTPWLGFGIDARTMIGTGAVDVARFNTRTAFDAINLSGVMKLNVLNAIKYDGTRRVFEPVVYTGLGWGHGTAKWDNGTRPNYMTWRTGVELNVNLGKDRAWAVVVNPSIVYGQPSRTEWATKLNKHNGMFELTAGVVYHFKTSNGTHSFGKARLYDADEVARLKNALAKKPHAPRVVEKVVKETVTVPAAESTYQVTFDQNSAVLSDAAKAILDKVPTNTTVNVAGSTSPEGTVRRNTELAVQRAQAVADYLKNRGVKVNSVEGGITGRAATVTVQK